jgi:hypothetical protein
LTLETPLIALIFEITAATSFEDARANSTVRSSVSAFHWQDPGLYFSYNSRGRSEEPIGSHQVSTWSSPSLTRFLSPARQADAMAVCRDGLRLFEFNCLSRAHEMIHRGVNRVVHAVIEFSKRPWIHRAPDINSRKTLIENSCSESQ